MRRTQTQIYKKEENKYGKNNYQCAGVIRTNGYQPSKSLRACENARLSYNPHRHTISPGWIDTAYTVYEGSDATQQPAGRVGNPMDIAHMVLFLCSDKAGFITGENICIDGGMTKQMIYHGDHGWKLEK